MCLFRKAHINVFRFCYITQDTLLCVISNTFYVFYVNPVSVPLSTLTYRTHNTCSIFVTEKALYSVCIMAHVNLTVYTGHRDAHRTSSETYTGHRDAYRTSRDRGLQYKWGSYSTEHLGSRPTGQVDTYRT